MKLKLATIAVLSLIVVTVVIGLLKLRIHTSENDDMFLLDKESEYTIYDVLTENMMHCDLATVSNIFLHMRSDGFEPAYVTYTPECVDMVLIKGDEMYRVLYKSNREFVSFGNPYEKSYIPMTYIHEGK